MSKTYQGRMLLGPRQHKYNPLQNYDHYSLLWALDPEQNGHRFPIAYFHILSYYMIFFIFL